MSPQKLRMAVMLETVQLVDIAGADLFGTISQPYVQQLAAIGMPSFVDAAPEIEFFFLGSELKPTMVTPGIMYTPSHTYDDCPRDLDILLVGGPAPNHRPKAADKFMKEAYPQTKLVFTTCVGSLWLASAGVMKGKQATTNREFLPMAKSLFPDVDWLDQRWVVDGKLWTAGGAGAGIEMILKYMMQTYDQQMVHLMISKALAFDPEEKGQFYNGPTEYSKQMLETDWKKVFPQGGDSQ